MKEFEAARRVDKGLKVEFKLNGQVYKCLADLPGGLLLDWVKAVTAPDLTTIEQAEKATEFFTEVMEEDSFVRFQTGLRDKADPITTDQLTDVLNWLVAEYQGVPLDEATPSVPGQSNTGTFSSVAAKSSKSTPSSSRRAAS